MDGNFLQMPYKLHPHILLISAIYVTIAADPIIFNDTAYRKVAHQPYIFNGLTGTLVKATVLYAVSMLLTLLHTQTHNPPIPIGSFKNHHFVTNSLQEIIDSNISSYQHTILFRGVSISFQIRIYKDKTHLGKISIHHQYH